MPITNPSPHQQCSGISSKVSDRFTTHDMTNCYYQFKIEDNVHKLYAFHTPWGIFQYKCMVMGTSPTCSEIQKLIRELIKNCTNAVHIKNDLLIHGKGVQHNIHLYNILKTLKKHNITIHPATLNALHFAGT